MDNVTHSLVGIALADVCLGTRPSQADRRLAVGAGIIAANLPDIDLAYSGIAPQPLGYLLHHRGHTHTIAGLMALACLLVFVYRRVRLVRSSGTGNRFRLWSLIAIALASHLLLDSLNSYGVHPFYPFDSRWYYGDAVFIFEPWLWLILGIAVGWSARSRTARLAALLPIFIFPVMLVSMAIVPPVAAASLAIAGVPLAWISLRQSPSVRAALALTMCLLVIFGLVSASRAAHHAVRASIEPELDGTLVDVILAPNPASPWCWAVIAIELNEASGEYVLRRGTLSLAPLFAAPTTCASHRFTGARELKRLGRAGEFALRDEIHQPLKPLRDLAQRDCRVLAWLRFGRAPVISNGSIFDLRFAERLGRNFTNMELVAPRDGCPSFLPTWGMPRADLISR